MTRLSPFRCIAGLDVTNLVAVRIDVAGKPLEEIGDRILSSN